MVCFFVFFFLMQKSIASGKPDNLPATHFITDNKLVQSDCNQSVDHPVLLPIPERSSSPPPFRHRAQIDCTNSSIFIFLFHHLHEFIRFLMLSPFA